MNSAFGGNRLTHKHIYLGYALCCLPINRLAVQPSAFCKAKNQLNSVGGISGTFPFDDMFVQVL